MAAGCSSCSARWRPGRPARSEGAAAAFLTLSPPFADQHHVLRAHAVCVFAQWDRQKVPGCHTCHWRPYSWFGWAGTQLQGCNTFCKGATGVSGSQKEILPNPEERPLARRRHAAAGGQRRQRGSAVPHSRPCAASLNGSLSLFC